MKRLVLFIFALCILFVYVGCKCSSDILASYDDVKITRGQFKQWLHDKQFSVDAILKSKKQQKDKLEMMAIEDIALKELEKENFQTTEKYKFLEEMAFESILLKRLYDKEIKEKTDFNEIAYHIRQILLRVRNFKIINNKKVDLTKDELEKAYVEAENKAKELITRIKSGEKFEEIAKLHSDDFSKKNGGDIGFVVKDMLPSEIANVIENKHGLIETPIRTMQGVYIIEVLENKNLTKKNLQKIIKDEMQAKRIEQMMLRKSANKFIEDLMNAADVSFIEKNCTSKNPKDVIFKVGDSVFTVDDLNKRISLFSKNYNMGFYKIDDTKKIEIAKNAFKVALLKRVALKEGIDKDEDFQREVQKRKNMLFAKEYMDYIASRNIEIKPQEIRNEYDKYKETRYTRITRQNGKQIKQIVPFNSVKEQIETMLFRKKSADNLAKWKRDMLHINKFTVYEDELEGK